METAFKFNSNETQVAINSLDARRADAGEWVTHDHARPQPALGPGVVEDAAQKPPGGLRRMRESVWHNHAIPVAVVAAMPVAHGSVLLRSRSCSSGSWVCQ